MTPFQNQIMYIEIERITQILKNKSRRNNSSFAYSDKISLKHDVVSTYMCFFSLAVIVVKVA